MNHLEIAKQAYAETADKQAEKGMRVYGKPLDPMEYGRDWLSMMDEEIIDNHQYLVAEKLKRRIIISEIRKLLDYKDNPVSKTEIIYWLDKLEGKS